jgi:trehalose 6-phosphate phosphatase
VQRLLSRACQPLLARLAREKTLCAFDFDGTLAPIVTHPGRARMRPRTRELLKRLSRLYPCAIFSGRSRADLRGKVQGSGIRDLAGNHGAEPSARSSAALRRKVAHWKTVLKSGIDDMPGVWIEDKGISLAVHYRQQPNKQAARRRIMRALASLDGVHAVGGKQVINLVAADAPHKGQALAAARDRLKCDWVLYVGDDDNDEDAFALSGNTVPVRVGQKRASKARYYLRNQAEMDTLLEALIGLRSSTPHK